MCICVSIAFQHPAKFASRNSQRIFVTMVVRSTGFCRGIIRIEAISENYLPLSDE